ncbi:hypothetical protein LOTGIDRAFT_141492 [Lottia gigantea]|uniref:F5/8 type C domain-containing protein n=1 Tax=Lottia gigantea TaxID=225164 RepID=V4A777_LOTGI|nr:hypothetical protein LOTGIDRAFT_141492 [Lottia gigantea]ESO99798.1 hypothetical protein LOTGIDRAFT_141492 [Lottia gigantea]
MNISQIFIKIIFYLRFFDDQQWLQIDLLNVMHITGVITQGRPDHPAWVKSYIVQTSIDGVNFNPYSDKGNLSPTILHGNTDSNTKVKQTFDHRVPARYVRIYPVTYQGQIAMRFELLGCFLHAQVHMDNIMSLFFSEGICNTSMGVENYRIVTESQLTASSNKNIYYLPSSALNNPGIVGDYTGVWIAKKNDVGQWIEVKFDVPHVITDIRTAGRHGFDQWVKSYKVQYSTDGIKYKYYEEVSGTVKIFSGNYDSETPVTNIFQTPIRTRYLRILPQTWYNKIALRMEIHGCYQSYSSKFHFIIGMYCSCMSSCYLFAFIYKYLRQHSS